MKATTKKKPTVKVSIRPPNMKVLKLKIKGSSPLMIHKFSAKPIDDMEAKQRAGSTARSRRFREPKDFEDLYEQSKYKSPEGWYGINSATFRNAAISACRVGGFVMKKAKLAIFILPDGYDIDGKTPLVRITRGKPEMDISPVRNETGVADLRARGIWKEWEATLRIRYDADILTQDDVVNLFARAGIQVGICEGRYDSKKSNGLGYGLFDILGGEA